VYDTIPLLHNEKVPTAIEQYSPRVRQSIGNQLRLPPIGNDWSCIGGLQVAVRGPRRAKQSAASREIDLEVISNLHTCFTKLDGEDKVA